MNMTDISGIKRDQPQPQQNGKSNALSFLLFQTRDPPVSLKSIARLVFPSLPFFPRERERERFAINDSEFAAMSFILIEFSVHISQYTCDIREETLIMSFVCTTGMETGNDSLSG